MNKLPTECILNIFTYLDSKSLIIMLLINKKYNKIIENNYIYIYSKKHYFNYNNNHTIKQLYLRDYYLNNFYNIIIYYDEDYNIKEKIKININNTLKCFLCRKNNVQIFKQFIKKEFFLDVPYCNKYCCVNDINKSIINNYGKDICDNYIYIS